MPKREIIAPPTSEQRVKALEPSAFGKYETGANYFVVKVRKQSPNGLDYDAAIAYDGEACKAWDKAAHRLEALAREAANV